MLSKYNIVRKLNNKLIIYNTLTSGVLALNEEYESAFNDIVNKGTTKKSDLLEELKKGEMIISDDTDEFNRMLVLNKMTSYNTNSLTLTIAPTSACNFKCPYCYEKGIEHKSMSIDVRNKLVEFLKTNYANLEYLSICWYGGEPLLNLDIIEELTKKIKEEFGEKLNYSASIVSNGYYLTRENVEKLKQLDVNTVQVTIDGSKKDHDSRRILHDESPTFDHIMTNMQNTYDLINISVRMNMDKNNIDDSYEILDYFEKYNLKNNISFYLAKVDNINGSCNDCNCLNTNEFSSKEIHFYKKAIERGFKCNRIPLAAFQGCGATGYNSLVISPEGDFYKCWDEIGRKSRNVGNIYDGINMNSNLIKWLSYNPIHDEECKECKFLPVCFGGCANAALESGKKNCSTLRYNVDEVIELLNLMRQQR
ncbi:radical SAM/SPASM domain-containing protein [uncultured Clostridium sp.]|uniref:radical SAM/SPASM domain-containing protein n=1 Tax=uncultured Clostridium sp. TaxID=59620 RepID=UPI0032164836